jgi:Fic family protein
MRVASKKLPKGVSSFVPFYLNKFPFSMAAGPPKPTLPVFDCTRESRKVLLQEIYADFDKLTDPHERCALANSGATWRNYYQPFDLCKYKDWEEKNKSTLQLLNDKRNEEYVHLDESVKIALSHQSAFIEGNRLTEGDTRIIFEELKATTNNFKEHGIDILRLVDHIVKDVPKITSNSSEDKYRDDVQMMCSNILAQEYTLHLCRNKTQILENNIKRLQEIVHPSRPQSTRSRVTDHRTEKSLLSDYGAYRVSSVQATKAFHTVYPYHQEVPGNMKILVEQANSELTLPSIHPVLYALKFYSTFLHIHPFHDGNGRVGRLLLLFILQKCGFTPPVFEHLDRNEYINALYCAQSIKDPTEYLDMMVNQMADNVDDERKSLY